MYISYLVEVSMLHLVLDLDGTLVLDYTLSVNELLWVLLLAEDALLLLPAVTEDSILWWFYNWCIGSLLNFNIDYLLATMYGYSFG